MENLFEPQTSGSVIRTGGRLLDTFESWLGTFSGTLTVIGLFLLILVFYELDSFPGHWEGLLYVTILLLTGLTAIAFVWFSVTVVRSGELPFGPAVALRQPRLPLLAKPFVAGWWLVYFAIAVFVAFCIPRQHLPHRGEGREVVGAMLFFGALSYNVTANVFLILALGSITRSRPLLERVWKYRLVWDVLFALLASVIVCS